MPTDGITVDHDLCDGCEKCVDFAPNTFVIFNAKAWVKVTPPPHDAQAAIEEAKKNCTPKAILIVP